MGSRGVRLIKAAMGKELLDDPSSGGRLFLRG
jgi:hypothetical protein